MSHTELPLKTRGDREAYIDGLKSRVGNDISFKEWFVLIYDWAMYELTLAKLDRAKQRNRKYAKRLNDTFTIFAFREDLNDPQ